MSLPQVCLRSVHEPVVFIVKWWVVALLEVVVALLLQPVMHLFGADGAVVLVKWTLLGEQVGARLSTHLASYLRRRDGWCSEVRVGDVAAVANGEHLGRSSNLISLSTQAANRRTGNSQHCGSIPTCSGTHPLGRRANRMGSGSRYRDTTRSCGW